MGRGNYFPNCESYNMVYVFIDGEDENENFDQDIYDIEYENFKEFIYERLPKSFVFKDEYSRDFRDEKLILAENEYGRVCIADNENNIALFFEHYEKESYCGFKEHEPEYYVKNKSTAMRVFADLLLAGYELYQRTSAWTSEKVESITLVGGKVVRKE